MSSKPVLVQVSPDAKPSPATLPIQIITENESGPHSVSINIPADKRVPATAPRTVTVPPDDVHRSSDSMPELVDDVDTESDAEEVAVPGEEEYLDFSPQPPPPSPKMKKKEKAPLPAKTRAAIPKRRTPSPAKPVAPRSVTHKVATPKSVTPKSATPLRSARADIHRRSAEVTSVAEAHRARSVQRYMSEHPELAEEFAQTIPVSPTSMSASPYASESKKKRHQKKEVERVTRSEDDEEEDEEIDFTEEEEEEEEQPAPPPIKKGKKLQPKKRPNPVEEEDDEEEDEYEDEDTFASQERGRKLSKRVAAEKAEDEEEEEGDFVDDEEEEGEELDGEEKEVGKRPAEARVPPTDGKKPMTEEEEALEKMQLIEDIKEAARAGFMPAQPPSLNMPLNVLRQISKFQDEKAAEAVIVGYMGSGLIGVVNLLETLNGRFDPLGKLLGKGKGLKMDGATEMVSGSLDTLYKPPFTKMYRKMRKSGVVGDMPPWLQIMMITTGIIGTVHKKNVLQEMAEEAKKEEQDPSSMHKAAEMLAVLRERERRAREMDSIPYHMDAMTHSGMTDADLEETLAKEFSGFDKLPALPGKRESAPVAAQAQAQTAAVAAAPAAKPFDSKKREAAIPVTQETQPTAISLVHEPSNDQEEEEDVALTHAGDDPSDGESDEDEEDEDVRDDPVIQIPSLKPK